MDKLKQALIAAGLAAAHIGVVHAAVSAEEAKQLGTTLTPVGAEKAGNKDGSIPAYTGGLTTAPAGYDAAKGVRIRPVCQRKAAVLDRRRRTSTSTPTSSPRAPRR